MLRPRHNDDLKWPWMHTVYALQWWPLNDLDFILRPSHNDDLECTLRARHKDDLEWPWMQVVSASQSWLYTTFSFTFLQHLFSSVCSAGSSNSQPLRFVNRKRSGGAGWKFETKHRNWRWLICPHRSWNISLWCISTLLPIDYHQTKFNTIHRNYSSCVLYWISTSTSVVQPSVSSRHCFNSVLN